MALTLLARVPDNAAETTAIHVSTSRITQAIQLHTFHLRPVSNLRWTPSQHIELQFPPDLDLIGGRVALDDERRRLELTPCSYRLISNQSCELSDNDDTNVTAAGAGTVSNANVEVQFVTRTGTLTSQIGLPRFRTLEASVVGCGGGFPAITNRDADGKGTAMVPTSIAVAGGVGISAFLATAAAMGHLEDKQIQESEQNMKPLALLWTLHVDDWEFVYFAIERRLLVVDNWSWIHVFLTTGTEKMAPGRAEHIVQTIGELSSANERLVFHFRRMQVDNLAEAIASRTLPRAKIAPTPLILFCGGKALEWQIKFWARGMNRPVAVHTTKMQK